MGIDIVPPVALGGLVAAVVAFAWAGGFRLLRFPRLAAAAAGIGLVVGLAVVLGVISASPRQLAERLPVLAVIGLAAGVLATGGRVRQVAGIALGLVGGAWWMAGAPLHPDSLLRAAPVALALLAAMGLALRGGAVPLPMGVAWLALAAGLAVAGARGPQLACALAGLGAVLGAMVAPQGMATRQPLAVTLAGIAAVPVLARGAPADLAAAAAPALALLAGPVLGRRMPAWLGSWLGPALAALPAVAAAWMLAR